MKRTESLIMSDKLKPRCPRDNHVMRLEPAGIRWDDPAGHTETLASYHCQYLGCCVRYDPANGYYTVINEPEAPYFVDEPGTNLERCPRHGTWLYRNTEAGTDRFLLKCGVEGCDYLHPDVQGIWLRE